MFSFFDPNVSDGSDVGVFNQDISNWDMSKVVNMSAMFEGAYKFNQEIGNWDVSSVKDMSSMFGGTYNHIDFRFNKYLGDWDVSSVKSMEGMFWFKSIQSRYF